MFPGCVVRSDFAVENLGPRYAAHNATHNAAHNAQLAPELCGAQRLWKNMGRRTMPKPMLHTISTRPPGFVVLSHTYAENLSGIKIGTDGGNSTCVSVCLHR